MSDADKIIKVGICVLVEKGGKFLFGKRKNHFGEGTWGVPGGHIEFGETMHEAAKRELDEETGLVADELEMVSILNQPKQKVGGAHYIQILFVVKKYHGELENKEPMYCEGWEWFPAGQLPDPLFAGHTNLVSSNLQGVKLVDPDNV